MNSVFMPSVLAALGYCSAFYFLALAVRTIPIGVANALQRGDQSARTSLNAAARCLAAR
jgi:multidrug transporter EmrE-like cation transporter